MQKINKHKRPYLISQKMKNVRQNGVAHLQKLVYLQRKKIAREFETNRKSFLAYLLRDKCVSGTFRGHVMLRS